ncbi:MAG: SdpI family protein [Bacteroidota bacterium]
MDYSSPLFITPLATGVVFALVGLYQLIWPPTKINDFYGYRTQNSRSSQERWDFAQPYSARLMIKLGLLLSCSSIMGLVWDPGTIYSTLISVGLLLVAVWQMHLRTESGINEAFGPMDQ